MFNPIIFENSPAPGSAVLWIIANDGVDVIGEPTQRFVPLKRSEVRGVIAGPLADLRLAQIFGFSRNVCSDTVEAVYRFPLPGDAAVQQVVVRFGDVEIRAELQERSAAENAYAEAKSQGKQAALATREGPDVFTLHVSGIQPDQEVVIETHYVQLARSEGLDWTLRIPLTTAPRFVRQDEISSGAEKQQPLSLMRDPGHRFALDMLVQGAGQVHSPTHELKVEEASKGLHVELAQGEVLPDRDCVLAWTPRQVGDRPALGLLRHDDATQGYTYFLAHVAPPAQQPNRGARREIVVLVDHSGSMTGPKWDAADWAVERFLSDLLPHDFFALAWFHNRTSWFEQKVQQADPDLVRRAVAWIKSSRDSGGTELGVALEQALRLNPAPDEVARHVIVITDAEVTDEGRILRLVDEEARKPQRRRISVLCIDAAPNAFLAQEMAERGGGVARFLTSQPDAEDIATALEQILLDWAQPALINLRLKVNRPHVELGRRQTFPSAEAGWSAIDLGDLPGGRTLWVIGRVPRAEGELVFHLESDSGQTIAVAPIGGDSAATPGLKALFGARRINGLEHLISADYEWTQLEEQLRRLGYDPARMLTSKNVPGSLYAENRRKAASEALTALLVEESLEYGLASSAIGFIAIRQEAGKVVDRSVRVANALPAGWSEQFLDVGARHVHPMTWAPPGVALGSVVKSAAAFAKFAPAALPFALHEGGAPAMPSPAASFGVPFTKKARGEETVFRGTPRLTGGRAVLYDSTTGNDILPEEVTFAAITLQLQGKGDVINPSIQLLLYVGDVATPRARMRLTDLARSGRRPLNVLRRIGSIVRIVLEAPAGDAVLPAFELKLLW